VPPVPWGLAATPPTGGEAALGGAASASVSLPDALSERHSRKLGGLPLGALPRGLRCGPAQPVPRSRDALSLDVVASGARSVDPCLSGDSQAAPQPVKGSRVAVVWNRCSSTHGLSSLSVVGHAFKVGKNPQTFSGDGRMF
jgi:hypothetical protein